MDKKKIEIIATSTLVLVFLLIWVNTFRQIKSKRQKSTDAAGASPEIVEQIQKQVQLIKAQQDLDMSLSWVRCPFSGKIYRSAKKADQELKLEGINWDVEKPMAVINGMILLVGDEINSKTIIAIEEDRVVLNDGKQNYDLLLE